MGISENSKINPQAVEIEIGIRSLRNIIIYPLSIADQMKMTDLIAKAIAAFFEVEQDGLDEEKKTMEFVSFIIELIKDNIGRILSFVTDENDQDKLLGELTNGQLILIAEIIFITNFESISKNAVSLFKKVKNLFQLERPLPPSVDITEDIDLNISTSEDTETEV